jgi:DNA-binding MarR family transcriptional regulator
MGSADILSLIASGYRLEAKLEAALAPLGLTLAKLNVLTHLAESHRSLALGEIAAKLQCVRSNVTQLTDRLETDGFVKRLYDPADRRTVRAELTDLGRERQTQGAEALAQAGNELAAALPVGDLAALGRLSSMLK